MFGLILAACLAVRPGPITPEILRARYADLRALDADLVQVKTGKYWARPLESHIKLLYTPTRVVWETLQPLHSKVVIEGSTLTVIGPDGQPRDLGAAAGDPRVAALLRFIRALLALDLPAIERDFTLSYGPNDIEALPRPGSDLKLFAAVRLHFDDDLELVSLELQSDTELTRLRFERVERDPARPAKKTAP